MQNLENASGGNVLKRTLLIALVSLTFAVAAASQLRAELPNVPITGAASFSGGTSASGPDCDACTVTISFSNDSFLGGSGIYTPIPPGTPVAFSSFSFIREGPNVTLVNPVPMFWAFTVGGNNYSFDLLALSDAHVESSAMTLSGTGMLHPTRFDPTSGDILMTADGTNFVYQMTFVAFAVPEPNTLALIGLTGIGAAVMAYRRRK